MKIQGKVLCTGLLAVLLTACQADQKMLGITGYNYTNRYIDGFSVGGQGGSNVLLIESASFILKRRLAGSPYKGSCSSMLHSSSLMPDQ